MFFDKHLKEVKVFGLPAGGSTMCSITKPYNMKVKPVHVIRDLNNLEVLGCNLRIGSIVRLPYPKEKGFFGKVVSFLHMHHTGAYGKGTCFGILVEIFAEAGRLIAMPLVFTEPYEIARILYLQANNEVELSDAPPKFFSTHGLPGIDQHVVARTVLHRNERPDFKGRLFWHNRPRRAFVADKLVSCTIYVFSGLKDSIVEFGDGKGKTIRAFPKSCGSPYGRINFTAFPVNDEGVRHDDGHLLWEADSGLLELEILNLDSDDPLEMMIREVLGELRITAFWKKGSIYSLKEDDPEISHAIWDGKNVDADKIQVVPIIIKDDQKGPYQTTLVLELNDDAINVKRVTFLGGVTLQRKK